LARRYAAGNDGLWIPACAGMTGRQANPPTPFGVEGLNNNEICAAAPLARFGARELPLEKDGFLLTGLKIRV
jgi:hypothetical protein